MNPHPRLSAPLRVGSVTLANRIVFAAHLTGFAEDGRPSERHAAYYAARAEGGAGLVVTEEFSVAPDDRPYGKMIAGWSPSVDEGSRRLVAAVHAAGVPVLAQVNHNGGQADGLLSRAPVQAVSAVADPLFREVPVALDETGLADLVAAFAATARRCRRNGFDGVEIQASQASLLRGFLSRATNRRDDGWGGHVPGRARLLLEVAAAVRTAVGSSAVVGVRLAADEGVEDGLTVQETVEVARLLEATGAVDYLNTTLGVATASLHLVEPPMSVPAGYGLHLPRALKAAVALPVVGVGRFTEPAQVEQALADGACDLVGVVRGQIADPRFASRARRGLPVRHCLGCNQDCIGRVGLNAPLACVVNPDVGREVVDLPSPRSAADESDGVDLVVVGAGPAGLRAAATAAGRGRRVVVFEQADEPGGLMTLAARAPHRADLAHLVTDLVAECADAGVDIRTGVRADAAAVLATGAGAVVVATGSTPVRPAWAPPDSDRVLDVREVLAGAAFAGDETLGGDVVVVDETGTAAATSVAELIAAAGADVEILTAGLVVGQDLALTLEMPAWRRRAGQAGITERTGTLVLGAEPGRSADGEDGLVLTLLEHATGATSRRTCSAVVVAGAGAADDTLWRRLRRDLPPGVPVHRVGDCLAPRHASAAVREGDRAGAAAVRALS